MRSNDMKKYILAVLLGWGIGVAQASDFVNHATNKVQEIPPAQVQVINFWAAWCQPCRKEMPDMNKWYQQLGKKQKVGMVGIALDSAENINQFLKQIPVQYPIFRYTGDNSRSMMKQFGNQIGVLPYTVVRADRCGYEEKMVGELTFDGLDKAVKKAKLACQK